MLNVLNVIFHFVEPFKSTVHNVAMGEFSLYSLHLYWVVCLFTVFTPAEVRFV